MKNIEKIKKLKEKMTFSPPPSVEEASSSLLNFIVKSKRETFLKKITSSYPKSAKKIIRIKKKRFSKKQK